MRELRYYAGRHKIFGKICDRIMAFLGSVQNTANVNRAAVRLATCGLCSWRCKLPHVLCFLAVSAGVLKVRLDTKVPTKFSYILFFSRKLLFCVPFLVCIDNVLFDCKIGSGNIIHLIQLGLLVSVCYLVSFEIILTW